MPISSMTVDDIVRIVSHGGGVRLANSNRMIDELVRIASHAKNGGGSLTLTGAKTLTVDEMVRISSHGKGCVFFED